MVDPVYCHVSCTKAHSISSDADLGVCLQLFIPAGRVYGLGDTIPFHIQLSGNMSVLRDLLSGQALDRVTSADTTNSIKPSQHSADRPLLKVSISRRVTLTMNASKGWKNTVIGEGTISPVPPDESDCCGDMSECRGGHIDWEGEVRVQDPTITGSFTAANVQVQVSIPLFMTATALCLSWVPQF